MIIGILSDTHDRTNAMAAGIETLKQAGATYFIHCGDIGQQGCVGLLAGLWSVFVFGNTDVDRQAKALSAIGQPAQATTTHPFNTDRTLRAPSEPDANN